MFTKEDLDELTNTYTDLKIAEMYGVSNSQIHLIRTRLGVESFRSKTQTLTFEFLDELSNQYTDEQIAKLTDMSASGVQKARYRLNVKSFGIKSAEWKKKTDYLTLNELTDSCSNIEVAQIVGWTREYVNARCKELGVKSFTQKTGNVKTSDGKTISSSEHNASIHIIPANNKRGKSQPDVRKNFFNERYFAQIDSEEKAYFLGLLIADGSVYKTTTSLSLTDSQPVYSFAKSVEADNDSVEKIPNHDGGKDQWRVRLNSIVMTQDLLKLGVTPCKTNTVPYPKISANLERHLIRGIWDGDGHVGKTQSYVLGNEKCLIGIQNALQSRGLPTAKKLSPYQGCFRLRVLKSEPQTLLWIYSDCEFYLPRKYDIAHSFWS